MFITIFAIGRTKTYPSNPTITSMLAKGRINRWYKNKWVNFINNCARKLEFCSFDGGWIGADGYAEWMLRVIDYLICRTQWHLEYVSGILIGWGDPYVPSATCNYSLSNVIMVDEKFVLFHQYLRYCKIHSIFVFSISSAIIWT